MSKKYDEWEKGGLVVLDKHSRAKEMTNIITIDEKSPYLENVIELGDANSKTLGFLPEAAFRKFANKKQILVAQDDTEKFRPVRLELFPNHLV